MSRSFTTLEEGTSPFKDYLKELHGRYKDISDGALANYIPELSRANSTSFAICAVTTAGTAYFAGDCGDTFTMQSVSKPFMYGLALQDIGREKALTRVGVEPTGDPFNSIIELDQVSNRPHNPMVNAGAIATAGLIKGDNLPGKFNRVLDMFAAYTGHRLNVDMAVYASERTTGHRNRSLAHLMLNFGMIDPNVDEILDLYFQQCSILVNARDLAMMGATLANGGTNPITEVRAIECDYIQDMLSVMYTCGMYDSSGQWAYDVGLPAKSGVGGGICVVVPGKMGIGVYSPLLDGKGHSIRGVKACTTMSQELGLHSFGAQNNVRQAELLPELFR